METLLYWAVGIFTTLPAVEVVAAYYIYITENTKQSR